MPSSWPSEAPGHQAAVGGPRRKWREKEARWRQETTHVRPLVSLNFYISMYHPYFTFTQPSFNFKLVASPNNLPHGFTSTGKKNRKRAPKQYEARIAYVYRCQNCAGHATIVTSYQDSRQMAHSMPGPALPAPRDSTQRHVSSARYNNDGAAADSITVMRGC